MAKDLQDLRSSKEKEIKRILEDKETARSRYEIQIDELTVSLKCNTYHILFCNRDLNSGNGKRENNRVIEVNNKNKRRRRRLVASS